MRASIALAAALLAAVGSLETSGPLSAGLLAAAVASFVLGAGFAVTDIVRGTAEHESTQDVPDVLGEGSAMIPKVGATEGPRAKALRPADSGVFRAVHGADNAALTGPCPTNDLLDTAPETPSSGGRLRSVRRGAMRSEVATAFETAMAFAGVSDPEVAAEVDEAPQRVGKMRGKALPLTADHLGLMARSRDPRLRQVFEDVVREMRGAK